MNALILRWLSGAKENRGTRVTWWAGTGRISDAASPTDANTAITGHKHSHHEQQHPGRQRALCCVPTRETSCDSCNRIATTQPCRTRESTYTFSVFVELRHKHRYILACLQIKTKMKFAVNTATRFIEHVRRRHMPPRVITDGKLGFFFLFVLVTLEIRTVTRKTHNNILVLCEYNALQDTSTRNVALQARSCLLWLSGAMGTRTSFCFRQHMSLSACCLQLHAWRRPLRHLLATRFRTASLRLVCVAFISHLAHFVVAWASSVLRKSRSSPLGCSVQRRPGHRRFSMLGLEWHHLQLLRLDRVATVLSTSISLCRVLFAQFHITCLIVAVLA